MESIYEKTSSITQDLSNFLSEHQIEFNQQTLEGIIKLCAILTNDYDESHDINHHVCVFKNSIIIFKTLEEQFPPRMSSHYLKIIIYVSLLHDTIDHKYPKNLEDKKDILNNFLRKQLEYNYIIVKWIIDNISYSKEVKNGYPHHDNKDIQLCRDIVSDADKLEAIGEIGIKRCRDFSIASNPLFSDDSINKLVVEHCNDKLLKLKDNFIRTAKGKELAQPLHQFLEKFVAEFN
jgi:uncharacterized protein